MTPRLAVAASIAAAPLLALGDELERLRSAGVDSIHIDIEDGVFVPEMNLGLRVLEEVVRWGRLPVDVHLMVTDPERLLRRLGALNVSSIAIHAEAVAYPRRVLRMITEMGCAAGLAFNPATSPQNLEYLAPFLEHVLLLTSEPESGGAEFLDAVAAMCAELVPRAAVLGARVVVDGGVRQDNAAPLRESGVHTVVVGRALVAADDPSAVVAHISTGEPHV